MKTKILYLTILSFFLNSCGANVLSGLSSQSSDDYYLEEATKANNAQNYDYALDILLNKISAGEQAKPATKELLASAYAGKCGFNFVEYVQAFADNTGTAVFDVMMQPFVGVEAHPEYCLSALQTIDSIGTPSQRTTNQNTFSAITGMVLLGISLRSYADKVDVPGGGDYGDGVMDAQDYICDNTKVTDNQLDDVIVGYGYFVTNFAYVSASLLGGDSMDGLSDSIDICNSLPGAACNVTDKTAVTPATRLIIRRLLNTVTYGIGHVVVNDPVTDIPTACP